MDSLRKLLLIVSGVILVFVALLGGAAADRLFGVRPLDYLVPRSLDGTPIAPSLTRKEVIKEESVVIDVVKNSLPATVTISIETPKRQVLEFSPFGGYGIRERPGEEQDLATGFIVSSDGLIVTNKHVVSQSGVKYRAIDKDGKEYDVKNIYRDPANDLALLKIEASNLPVLELGDSDSLQVGQTVIAVGTPLGEFRQSVTTGVISGLGRGISTGSPFEGVVERLDNVIQTDAAINPGNSGGPLLDSGGRVIGVNVAVAAGAQNIGFAIPINIVKDSISGFRETGEFIRPFLGVQYQIITKEAALINEVPQGAYVRSLVKGSSAEKAGIEEGDIITKFSGEKIDESQGGLAVLVNKRKVGETVSVEVWRGEKTLTLQVTLLQAE